MEEYPNLPTTLCPSPLVLGAEEGIDFLECAVPPLPIHTSTSGGARGRSLAAAAACSRPLGLPYIFHCETSPPPQSYPRQASLVHCLSWDMGARPGSDGSMVILPANANAGGGGEEEELGPVPSISSLSSASSSSSSLSYGTIQDQVREAQRGGLGSNRWPSSWPSFLHPQLDLLSIAGDIGGDIEAWEAGFATLKEALLPSATLCTVPMLAQTPGMLPYLASPEAGALMVGGEGAYNNSDCKSHLLHSGGGEIPISVGGGIPWSHLDNLPPASSAFFQTLARAFPATAHGDGGGGGGGYPSSSSGRGGVVLGNSDGLVSFGNGSLVIPPVEDASLFSPPPPRIGDWVSERHGLLSLPEASTQCRTSLLSCLREFAEREEARVSALALASKAREEEERAVIAVRDQALALRQGIGRAGVLALRLAGELDAAALAAKVAAEAIAAEAAAAEAAASAAPPATTTSTITRGSASLKSPSRSQSPGAGSSAAQKTPSSAAVTPKSSAGSARTHPGSAADTKKGKGMVDPHHHETQHKPPSGSGLSLEALLAACTADSQSLRPYEMVCVDGASRRIAPPCLPITVFSPLPREVLATTLVHSSSDTHPPPSSASLGSILLSQWKNSCAGYLKGVKEGLSGLRRFESTVVCHGAAVSSKFSALCSRPACEIALLANAYIRHHNDLGVPPSPTAASSTTTPDSTSPPLLSPFSISLAATLPHPEALDTALRASPSTRGELTLRLEQVVGSMWDAVDGKCFFFFFFLPIPTQHAYFYTH